MYSESGLFFDVIHVTQNSVSVWGFVESIKIEKFVAYVYDEETHAAGVVEQAPAE